MKSKKIVTSTKFLLLISALAVIIVGLGILFWWPRHQVNDIETFIGAELPGRMLDHVYATNDEKGHLLWLRITMPFYANPFAFVTELGLAESLREGFTPFPNLNYKETGIDWWTPQSALKYWGLHAIRNNKVYELLIDSTDEQNHYLVYLRVYEL